MLIIAAVLASTASGKRWLARSERPRAHKRGWALGARYPRRCPQGSPGLPFRVLFGRSAEALRSEPAFVIALFNLSAFAAVFPGGRAAQSGFGFIRRGWKR